MARTQTAPVPGYAAARTRARTTMWRLGIATFRARRCLATGAWADRTFVSRVLTTCGMHCPVPRACPTSHPVLCAARWIFNGLETPVSFYWRRDARGCSATHQQHRRTRGRSAAGPRHSGHGDLDSRDYCHDRAGSSSRDARGSSSREARRGPTLCPRAVQNCPARDRDGRMDGASACGRRGAGTGRPGRDGARGLPHFFELHTFFLPGSSPGGRMHQFLFCLPLLKRADLGFELCSDLVHVDLACTRSLFLCSHLLLGMT
jgi:hypothetical protein